jgi:arginase family enzyme
LEARQQVKLEIEKRSNQIGSRSYAAEKQRKTELENREIKFFLTRELHINEGLETKIKDLEKEIELFKLQ